ncbi:LysR family transcriptional regulator [Trinickia violacea]|uniref:LysR family transcriptional regulator n=1 Tax=Trinickia violacea TaxID=2571746 RepID=A0A4V1EH53_9BURK|nr:LysR family transcriptional regulator [Trinickia violacea]QCP49070.1 LysR family transcriptional regulator [Trinickia violacea]
MKMLDHDVMATIVAIVETGNMSRAAETVNRSQSAVSMQIKSLEEALGRQLFVRRARSVLPTREGEVLLGFARRMLALRDEAWAAVVRPDVTGKVVIGVPDDYASSLLPSVLKKFSATYPKVEIQVIGLPSSALAPLIKEGAVDLVCGTKVKGLSGEFVRLEPMAWAADVNGPRVWEERPLPIAVFLPGSVARENAIRSLQKAKVPYRTSYESPSLLGLLSMVEAGLAVAPLARCAIPAQLAVLGRLHGLPELPSLELVLARSAKSSRPPCDFLAEQIIADLRGQPNQSREPPLAARSGHRL